MDSPVLYIYPYGRPEDAYQLWPDSDEPPTGAICEGGRYIFELRGVENPLNIELNIDREETEPLRPSKDMSAARWSWEPGFHAGFVDIVIDFGDGRTVSTRAITDPDLRKLTREQFNRMVRDILDDTLALFNLSGFKAGVSRGQGDEVPPIARLEFLRSRMEDLEGVIHRVAQRPVRLLSSEDRSVPLHKARTATGPEIARSFRTERIRKEASDQHPLPSRFEGYFPKRIRKSTQASGLDIREHQDMKSSLRSWSRWLRVIGDRLEADSKSTQHRKAREAKRCYALSSRLQNLLHLPLFENVTDRPSPVRITSIYRRVPAYRSFFRIQRDLNLGIARATGDFLQIPLARTFELYEIWCFLRLLRASTRQLSNVDVDPIFEFDPESGSVTVSASHTEVPLKSGLTLCFKRRYREYWLNQSGRGSFSRTMEPDLSLAVSRTCSVDPGNKDQDSGKSTDAQNDPSSDEPNALIVLDAKYRIESGLNEAVASIHKYRDALVEERGKHHPRIVNAAYLLSPHPLEHAQSEWQDADMPDRLFYRKYRGIFQFGAITLQPGMSIDEVHDTLQAILEDAQV